MTIYPALDLRGGAVVRLRQGDPAAQTTFSQDPAAVARAFHAAGAEWLHVVNLDGALGASSAPNLAALDAILAATPLPVQFGGGIRSASDIRNLLARGVRRVIVGTLALEQPEQLAACLAEFGATALAVALDVRDGRVASRGWQTETSREPVPLARELAALGVTRVIYTDIARDGMLSGIDAGGCARLARASGLQVIASGGAAGLADLAALQNEQEPRLEGLIIGQALYTGAIHLPQALAAARALFSAARP